MSFKELSINELINQTYRQYRKYRHRQKRFR